MSRVLLALMLLLTAGCTSVAGGGGPPDKGYISGTGVVSLVPMDKRKDPVVLAGKTLTDKQFSTKAFASDVVVVNVWASWCPPCIKEAAVLQDVWSGYQSRDDVRFVGVDVGDNRAAALAHERRFDVTYPSLDDQAGRSLLVFRSTLSPTTKPATLVLDRQHRVAARVLGSVDASTLRGIVDDVLAEPA